MSSLFRAGMVRCVVGACAAYAAVSGGGALHAGEAPPREDPGVETRRRELLEQAVSRPFPKRGEPWGDLVYAIAALALDRDVAGANAGILAIRDRGGSLDHWRLQQAHRLILLFGSRGRLAPGRLAPEAEEFLVRVTADFVRSRSDRTDADPAKTWFLHDSENHDIMFKTSYFFGALILAGRPDYAEWRYADGGTPAEHAAAWNRFFRRYLAERGRHGLFIEVASPTYSKYTLGSVLNLHDLSPDPELRRLAENVLDLYWADWAQDCFDGIRTGAGSRVYSGLYSDRGEQDGTYALQYLYFGFGEPRTHMTSVFALTGEYRVPELIVDLARDVEGRGVYETSSRRPGDPSGGGGDGVYGVIPGGRQVRYGWHTPEYVLGSTMIDPGIEYSGISAQNRRQGIFFRQPAGSRVYAMLGSTREDKAQTYDAFVAVQHRNILMLRKNFGRHKYNLAPIVRVAGTPDERAESAGRVFLRFGAAYLELAAVPGGFSDAAADSLTPVNEEAVLVFRAGREDEDGTFAAFCSQPGDLPAGLSADADGVSMECPDGTLLGIPYALRALPWKGGEPLDLEPDFAFRSPFIRQAWGSDTAVVTKEGKRLDLSFAE